MSDLDTFTEHVQDVLCDAYRLPHWTPEEAGTYMADFKVRRQRFEQLAQQLTQKLIRPRQEAVSNFFQHAFLKQESSPNQSSCWFSFCHRFPVVSEIEFTVDHDIRFKKLILHMRTRMMPAIVRLSEQDSFSQPLDSVKEEDVADWVEERLLEFLDAYLQIDTSGDTLDEPATDPVCGMKLLRSTALASDLYFGHPYYFCCQDCRAKFQENPKQYLS